MSSILLRQRMRVDLTAVLLAVLIAQRGVSAVLGGVCIPALNPRLLCMVTC